MIVYEDVFQALGRPDADDMRTRVAFASVLTERIRQNGWDTGEAADRLGLTQADLTRLRAGNVREFDQRRLNDLLVRFHVRTQG